MKRRFMLGATLLSSCILLTACPTASQEYYEVHIMENNPEFRYVNPDEESLLLPNSTIEDVAEHPIYLYIPNQGTIFDYTQYFSFLGDHFIYRHVPTEKIYILVKDSMAATITQFYIDKDIFDSSQS